MSAESVVYYLNPSSGKDPFEETEWLLDALGQYTGAELRELLYVAQEPEFFELMRGLFALSDESRLALQNFVTSSDTRPARAVIDQDGRCILHRGPLEQPGKPNLKIVS